MTSRTPEPQDGEPLSALLERSDAPALVIGEDGHTLTHAQLADRIEVVAGRLAAAGVHRGDRVALVMPNGPEFIQLFLAITLVGAAAAPLNPAYTHSEFVFYLTDIAPKLMIVPASRPVATISAAEERSLTVLTVQPGDDGPPALFVSEFEVDSKADFEVGQPDDVAVVLHTSGTTSRPKQVPLLQRNLMATVRTIGEHYQLGSGDVSFCVMPLFHVHGLVASTLATLGSGGSVIVPRRFTPQRFWRQARQRGEVVDPAPSEQVWKHLRTGEPAMDHECKAEDAPAAVEGHSGGVLAPELESLY